MVWEEIRLRINSHRKFGIILVIDEDGFGISARRKYVEEKLAASGLTRLAPSEGSLVVIPVRNVETWMAWAARHLNPKSHGGADTIDERANYKTDRHEPKSDAYTAGKLMAAFDPSNPPPNVPPAMREILAPLNEFADWTRVP